VVGSVGVVFGSSCVFAVVKLGTGGQPYPRIQYPQFQLSAVGRGPKQIWKIKELAVHKFKNVRQARADRNMVKSSSPNAPST
jgi:hypothetical protein